MQVKIENARRPKPKRRNHTTTQVAHLTNDYNEYLVISIPTKCSKIIMVSADARQSNVSRHEDVIKKAQKE
jgi:hypothetical protein